MELLKVYIAQRKRVLLAFIAFCFIFALSFYLYRLPLKAVLYPAVLCAMLGAGLLAADFLRVRQLHARLCTAKRLTAAMLDTLPEPDGIVSADYRDLVLLIRQELIAAESDASARYRDMMDYYTAWVHQIKTPIASMRLKLEGLDSAASREMSSDLFRVEQYVEMVLAFLRLDSESGDYVFAEQELDGIIKSAVRRFSSEFIMRRLSLRYEPVCLRVVTDEKWLEFVIEQLLSNALKYTRSGSISIYLREPATLCIEDTGIGIAASDLPRVFEKGYTGYNGRSDKRASGIGLYLCRQVCDRLGIGIAISSEEDVGTTVCLDLSQYDLKTE